MSQTVPQLLAAQLKDAHQIFLGTLDAVTDEVANFQPGGKALSIVAVWGHLTESEDMFLSVLQKSQSLSTTEFSGKTGLSQPQPTDNWAETYPKWTQEVRATTAQLLDYTKAVFAASEKFLDSLDPAILDQTIDLGAMGQPTGQTIISGYLIAHCNQLTGEISAIKGIQGLKGYPF